MKIEEFERFVMRMARIGWVCLFYMVFALIFLMAFVEIVEIGKRRIVCGYMKYDANNDDYCH